ncbi:hypothetical protein DM860_014310 [Cuscuta australis]|uniref:RING-type E3 ubiquitin transferase n=1 Tax=Cuscuta australis TaxID=267555 RepID=A0A328DHS0_9ASTE|nr:hypothetical protein DM860_014310 [Cuscuta australis]
MAMDEESKKSPDVKKSENANPLFSPGFRSVAEMAGWDEEALLIASLVVEETPDRNPKQRRRSVLVKDSGTPPPANSRRKRVKAQTSSPMPVAVLNLDGGECQKLAMDSELSGGNNEIGEPSKAKKFSDLPSSSSSSGIRSAEPPPAIPCIEKLREELSCAICLEICFEPSTTPCGHSFCKKCLRSAADKCGKKCPKCRQLISNARSCTVNTVLWNTIQLLFPEEVEARKKAAAIAKDAREQTPAEKNHHHHHHISRNRRVPVLINSPERMNPRGGGAQRRNFGLNGVVSSRRGSDFISVARPRRGQVEEEEDDAALALRLQREEFMGIGSNNGDQQQQQHRRNSLALARENLRTMASRAINIRRRT